MGIAEIGLNPKPPLYVGHMQSTFERKLQNFAKYDKIAYTLASENP